MPENRISGKEVTESLTCILTEEEIVEASRRLATIITDLDALEDQRKGFISQLNATKKGLEARRGIEIVKISTGKELRPVLCWWDFNWVAGTKTLWRMDNKAEVKTLPITETDRQEGLIPEGELVQGDAVQEGPLTDPKDDADWDA